jgi:DNA-binding MarR family transcriptional regulator
LGRCTGIDRSDVVAAINAMAERGFVARSPDPADGRRNVVTLTPAGRQHLKRVSALLADAQSELLRALAADESKTLVELLTRVLDSR